MVSVLLLIRDYCRCCPRSARAKQVLLLSTGGVRLCIVSLTVSCVLCASREIDVCYGNPYL